jgi:3-methyl-2-oxobutanoate hydroxymethyltransferase
VAKEICVSHHRESIRKKATVPDILKAKALGKKISMLTCYDAAFAKIINQTTIDMVLVGDSLANVMMGYDSTLKVSIDDMVRYCGSVARTLSGPLLCVDMPFLSYQVSPEEALRNAGRLIAEGGGQAVKLEGGTAIAPTVKKIIEAGIPVIGHLGLTPQHIHQMGGYRVQAKDKVAAKQLMEDAVSLAEAGIFALVLEMIPAQLAGEVTAAIDIPTIGIGAGPMVDGQVLVLHDLLGFDQEFNPKFLKKYANLGALVREAINHYDSDVKQGLYPLVEHSFSSSE